MRLAGGGGSHPYIDVALQPGDGVGPALSGTADNVSHVAENTGSAPANERDGRCPESRLVSQAPHLHQAVLREQQSQSLIGRLDRLPVATFGG